MDATITPRVRSYDRTRTYCLLVLVVIFDFDFTNTLQYKVHADLTPSKDSGTSRYLWL